MLRTDMYQDRYTAEHDIAGSLDLIIDLKRLPAGRIVVDSIYEVAVCMPEPQMRDAEKAYTVEASGSEAFRIQHLLQKNLLSEKHYELKKLVEYMPKTDTWHISACPGEAYFEKMARYVSDAVCHSVKQIFSAIRE